MKKILLLSCLFSVKIAFAQIANGSFEVWDSTYTNTYASELITQYAIPNPLGGELDSWVFDVTFGQSRTTDSYAGNYALILHNWYSYAYQSVAYDDTISYSPQFLRGYYKYVSGNTNGLSQGNLRITLTHFNGNSNDTVATGTYQFDTIASYTLFQLPINYTSTVVPDSVHIKILNGNTQCLNGSVCNLLYLDDFALSNSPLAIENNKVVDDVVLVYPNPSKGNITIKLPTEGAEIRVVDMLGKEIIKINTTQKTKQLQIENNGVYIIYVQTKTGTTAQKLVVNK